MVPGDGKFVRRKNLSPYVRLLGAVLPLVLHLSSSQSSRFSALPPTGKRKFKAEMFLVCWWRSLSTMWRFQLPETEDKENGGGEGLEKRVDRQRDRGREATH